MKKLLLGLVLLAALVGISYLKTTLEAEQKAEAFIDGHQVGLAKSEAKQSDVDSLEAVFEKERRALAEAKAALEDTVASKDEQYSRVVDSLTARLDDLQDEINSLKKQLAAKPKTTRKSASARRTSGGATDSQIADHYKLAVSRLPSDLSAYEHRVALSEVKKETAEKFKITMARLDEIRKEYDLE